ncbi:MAG: alpha/beta hydrolase [Ancylobacter novellus]|uniref:Alpha/beta hydrolase n=1 Tax=Ancylobacter novellus TaxID=921 RepID=A0A2W5KQA5_ANCNO|nr:MAG: alpha/beta hydrolase [Ancylobacter novellus]
MSGVQGEHERGSANAEAAAVDAGSRKPKPYGDGLCLSGGGYRAMLFHAGALARLNEAGMLSRIEVIGSVSGGSIAAAVLAKAWPDLDFDSRGVAHGFRQRVLEPLLTFSQAFVDAPALVKGVLLPTSSAAGELARAYSRMLFGEARLKDLNSGPIVIFCASNLSTGSLLRMSRSYVADYRIGVARDADWRLADVVACSSAFPPFLSPLRIDLSPHDWVDEKRDGSVGQKVSPRRAVITDGGVYDNHGIEPVMKRCRRVFVSDGGAPWRRSGSGLWDWFSQLKRVLDTTDNQVRSLRRRELITTFQAARAAAGGGVDIAADPAFTRGCYWSIAPSAALLAKAKNLAAFLDRAEVKPMDIPTVLHFLGEAETATVVNWGYLVTDQALRAHVDTTLAPANGEIVDAQMIKPTREARLSRAIMSKLGF